jgi:hypothetical protein
VPGLLQRRRHNVLLSVMRTRESLERAFASYWPPPQPKSKSFALARTSEPKDRLGLGKDLGWSDWHRDGEAFGVLVRVSMDGVSLQFHNTTGEVKKVEAKVGNETFRLTIDGGRYREIHAKSEGGWWWTVVQ